MFVFNLKDSSIQAFPLPPEASATPTPLRVTGYTSYTDNNMAYDKLHDTLYVGTNEGIGVYENASRSKYTGPVRMLLIESDRNRIAKQMSYDSLHDILYVQTVTSHSNPVLMAFNRPSRLTGSIKPDRTIALEDSTMAFAFDFKRGIVYWTRPTELFLSFVIHALPSIDILDNPEALVQPGPVRPDRVEATFIVVDSSPAHIAVDAEHDRLYFITNKAKVYYIDNASQYATTPTPNGRWPRSSPVLLPLPPMYLIPSGLTYDAAGDRLYVPNVDRIYEVRDASKLTATSVPDVRTISLPAGTDARVLTLP